MHACGLGTNYHNSNQCFKLLEKVEELANLPALRLIDDTIRPEPEPGAVREWLQALSVTLYQSRKSQPCCAELRRATTTWFTILTLPAVLEVYDLKTCDHCCICHLIPQIHRNSNVVQFATFSTEHDNSILRGGFQHHTMHSVGGRYAGVGSDVK
jgi:hypothetical protein